MRGVPGNANVSLRWNTPHPSRRCAPIHLLPQGEKGGHASPAASFPPSHTPAASPAPGPSPRHVRPPRRSPAKAAMADGEACASGYRLQQVGNRRLPPAKGGMVPAIGARLHDPARRLDLEELAAGGKVLASKVRR